jgi:hypothetical protein
VKAPNITGALTSDSRIISPIELAEERVVDQAQRDVEAAKEVGATRLLLAQMDWDRLYDSAPAPVSRPSPSQAKSSLTREASRRRWARQKALRSGPIGLARALA